MLLSGLLSLFCSWTLGLGFCLFVFRTRNQNDLEMKMRFVMIKTKRKILKRNLKLDLEFFNWEVCSKNQWTNRFKVAVCLCSQNVINNGNRTEWSPIRSVIIWVINKIGRPRSGSLICKSQVWLQTELDDTKSCYQLIITVTISANKKYI